MSKQLKITAGIKYDPSVSGLKGIDSGLREVFEASEADYTHGTMEITDTEAQLTLASAIGTPGYVFIINTDEETDVVVGFADVSTSDDARPITVKPKSVALFHAAGNIYARVSSGTARIEYFIFEAE